MLQDRLKPLTTSMKLVGIYHLTYSSKVESTRIEGVKTTRKLLASILSLRSYSFVVLILLWANFLWHIPGLFPIDSTITVRIILLMYYALVAFSCTIMFVASEKSSHLQSFYKHWNDMWEGAKSLLVDIKGKSLPRFIIITTLTSWGIVLTNLIGVIFLNFFLDIGFSEDALRPFPVSDVTKCAGCVIITLANGINIFSVMFLINACHIIKTYFYKLSDVLRKQIQDGGGSIPVCLREIRLLHVQLCECVSVLDRTFGILITVYKFFVTGLSLACFIVYRFVNYQHQLFMILMYLFWLMFDILTLCSVAISASLVHEAAHSPLDHIFKIQGKTASVEETLQLTSRQVGFTVTGTIVVTKELLFTIAGLFITYFFLLLQFRIS